MSTCMKAIDYLRKILGGRTTSGDDESQNGPARVIYDEKVEKRFKFIDTSANVVWAERNISCEKQLVLKYGSEYSSH